MGRVTGCKGCTLGRKLGYLCVKFVNNSMSDWRLLQSRWLRENSLGTLSTQRKVSHVCRCQNVYSIYFRFSFSGKPSVQL